MSAAKSPKALSLIVVVALVAALAIAGCGGAGGKVVSGQTPPSNPPSPAVEPQGGAGTEAATGEEGEEAGGEEATSEGEEGASAGEEATSEGEAGGAEAEGAGESEEAESGGEAAAGATASAEGMTVFTTNCGSCHTLAAAGTSGNVGPNLDELMPSESTVEYQVINGGGPMPAFGKEEILSAAEVKAVAAYVSSEAGK